MADFEENVEEMVGTTRERRMATESGGDETGDETSGPGDETGDKTEATLVTNETAATGRVMYMDVRKLEFDEDEIAAFEGQRLVVESRCGIY